MISPNRFYESNDHPTEELKQQMWNAIEKGLRQRSRATMFIVDRRSFLYGVAASLVFAFTAVGLYATFQRIIDSSEPQSIRLDSAYEMAIRQFERFVPATASVTPVQKEILSTRQDQLKHLDAAILDLKKEMNGNDISPLKRARLRQLYSMKLQIIQEMIEQGEIEL